MVPPHPGRCPGFTLTELLVVIAVIAVLAAMLLGSTKIVRKSAYSGHCTSNLHQVSLASLAYSGDNDGAMVPNYGTNPNGQNAPSYFDFLYPYVLMNSGNDNKQKKNVFICPGGRPMKVSSEGGWDWLWNYGLNAATHPNFDVGSNWRTVFLSQIPKHSQVIDIADGTQPPSDPSGNSSRVISVYKNWETNNGAYDNDSAYKVILQGDSPDSGAGLLRYRHGMEGYPGQRCNIAFVDGHVAGVPHLELIKSSSFAASVMP